MGGRWDPIFGVVNPGPHTYKMTPSWRGFVILTPPPVSRFVGDVLFRVVINVLFELCRIIVVHTVGICVPYEFEKTVESFRLC